MNAPIKIKEPGSNGRTYSFSCSFAGLAAMATAATLALSLFFVLGVLVGRGHRPEAVIPPIERIMPTEAGAKPAPSDEILKAEELQYSEQLAKKGTEATLAKSIDAVEHKAPEKAKPEAKPDAKGNAKPDAKSNTKAEAKPEAKDEDTQRYDYIYQAASFPDENQAKAFLQRVKGAGLKASIENGTANNKPWFRVVVFFRGTPNDTRGLKEKLAGLGVPKPLMRAKTPF
ncbi:MAG: SPOR domain-containing protein [Humidesulfovibrio sp.]|uniref:SPOR domain-containing protein n=1 Tax=Humidesulfovibrio sp. TaxID=2910988 RepID=UPI0027EB361B|nr:SPOR domain-containing protein [Humidesulfovibrio sp.]MDQ7836831.1 SPOR domain-containing protein [Humidesulfovibrio sp.]